MKAVIYLINTVSQLYIGLVLMRFLMQWARVDFYNPLAQFIVRATNPLLRPLRRFIPSVLGLDVASVSLALVLQIITFILITAIQGQFSIVSWAAMLSLSTVILMLLVLHIYLAAALLLFVVSWLAPDNNSPLTVLAYQLIKPLTSRIRHYIPSFHGMDFSLFVICVSIGLIKLILINPLMAALGAI
jgi:YggT family protein